MHAEDSENRLKFTRYVKYFSEVCELCVTLRTMSYLFGAKIALYIYIYNCLLYIKEPVKLAT